MVWNGMFWKPHCTHLHGNTGLWVVPERVVVAGLDALVAAALDVVRDGDARASVQKHLQDLVVVAVSWTNSLDINTLFTHETGNKKNYRMMKPRTVNF